MKCKPASFVVFQFNEREVYHCFTDVIDKDGPTPVIHYDVNNFPLKIVEDNYYERFYEKFQTKSYRPNAKKARKHKIQILKYFESL